MLKTYEKRDFYPDGNYDLPEVKVALDNDFSSEKELCDFIESHMEDFCHDFLGVELATYKREYLVFQKANRGRKNNKRIDFLIVTKCGQSIAVECKNPKQPGSELAAGIGQVMSYICLFEALEQKIDRYLILSTKVDFIIPMMIRKFNLPIEFYATDKKKHVKLLLSDRK